MIGDVTYRFLNSVPNQVTQIATPYQDKERLKAEVGVYLQDQWTMRRLTLNLGLRFDYLNAFVPSQYLGAGPWVPGRRMSSGTGSGALSARVNCRHVIFCCASIIEST